MSLNNNSPLVSVVMAVKNGGNYLNDSVNSILNQTFKNFEFIIIDDGSIDNTLEILKEYSDPRIRIFSQENIGLAKSLNRGLALAKGKYIARQDHDDISLPTRLDQQVKFLDVHPKVALVGTGAEIHNESGSTGRFHDHPTNSAELKFNLIFNNPFVHTSWMFRKDEIMGIGGYTEDKNRQPPEDYELVSRVAQIYEIANLPDRLVLYREVSQSMSSMLRVSGNSNEDDPFLKILSIISAENLAYFSGSGTVNLACKTFGQLIHGYKKSSINFKEISKVESLIKESACKIQSISGCNLHSQLEKKLEYFQYQSLVCERQFSLMGRFKYLVFRMRNPRLFLKLSRLPYFIKLPFLYGYHWIRARIISLYIRLCKWP